MTGFRIARIEISDIALPQDFPAYRRPGSHSYKYRLLRLIFVLLPFILTTLALSLILSPHSTTYLSVAHHGRRSKETGQYLPP
jgi:hypothetical protein